LFRRTFKRSARLTVAAIMDSGKVPGLFKPALRLLGFELAVIPAGVQLRGADVASRLFRTLRGGNGKGPDPAPPSADCGAVQRCVLESAGSGAGCGEKVAVVPQGRARDGGLAMPSGLGGQLPGGTAIPAGPTARCRPWLTGTRPSRHPRGSRRPLPPG